MSKAHIWTEERLTWLKENTPGHSYLEIHELYTKAFPDFPLTVSQIRFGIRNHHLNTGHDGRFRPGESRYPESQFKKGQHVSTKTEFKKGNIPKNHKPVGTISFRDCKTGGTGYYYIKTAEPNQWELYHQYLWKQAGNTIPDGWILTFKDGDTHNCSLENLALTTKKRMAVIANLGLTKRPADMFDTINAMADLHGAMYRKKRKSGE